MPAARRRRSGRWRRRRLHCVRLGALPGQRYRARPAGAAAVARSAGRTVNGAFAGRTGRHPPHSPPPRIQSRQPAQSVPGGHGGGADMRVSGRVRVVHYPGPGFLGPGRPIRPGRGQSGLPANFHGQSHPRGVIFRHRLRPHGQDAECPGGNERLVCHGSLVLDEGSIP
jgi:hypothetical protein